MALSPGAGIQLLLYSQHELQTRLLPCCPLASSWGVILLALSRESGISLQRNYILLFPTTNQYISHRASQRRLRCIQNRGNPYRAVGWQGRFRAHITLLSFFHEVASAGSHPSSKGSPSIHYDLGHKLQVNMGL